MIRVRLEELSRHLHNLDGARTMTGWTYLAALKLKRVEAGGAGQCFFLSMAYQMLPDGHSIDERQEVAQQLRTDAVDYIQTHPDEFPMVTLFGMNGQFLETPLTFEAACDNLRQPNNYADETIITALAKARKLNILILYPNDKDGIRTTPLWAGQEEDPCYMVAYLDSSLHYQAVMEVVPIRVDGTTNIHTKKDICRDLAPMMLRKNPCDEPLMIASQ
jgi:OTU-like cysteine protease